MDPALTCLISGQAPVGVGPISFRQGLTVCMASATLLSEDRSPGAPSYATDSSPHSHGEVWKGGAEEEGEMCVCVGGEGAPYRSVLP